MKRSKAVQQMAANPQIPEIYEVGQLPPAPQLPEQLLLRPTEVARVLGIGRSTVYELIHAGELPTIHVGRAVRISRRAVETWIEEHTAAEGLHRVARP